MGDVLSTWITPREQTISWKVIEQNGIIKEEILLTWKVTRIRIRLFGSIRRPTEPKSDSSVQSSSITTPLDRSSTMEQGINQATLRKADARVCE
jgi:hypothetical protein